MNLGTPIISNKRKWLVIAVVLFVIALAVIVFESPAIADLSEENRHQIPTLKTQWQDGEVIVLIRHLERCDKADSPCLTGTEGITARSVDDGQALGADFHQLGLLNSDIFNSPLDRTAQTESIVFGDRGFDRDWLFKCKKTIFKDALANKAPGKNLILVTHSSCIDSFEESLGYSSETPEYGTSLFFSPGSNNKLEVHGFLEMDDWDHILGF
ncbi:lipopolysaccharide core heptose(II)-phosphate phosphatase PmrG [Porticoccus hydrocarbonoclasticus]|uniref:lipopolysaccharide core heptose(II)-phosphate phosphatase PmrG n=1 Tax=Porticoccus hydrocarbonoclasticus TaxID=1073414 RepID=UPI000691B3BC|nr:histidine phosphatase family protein [Porticoccus hydrocarbonoclasticus]